MKNGRRAERIVHAIKPISGIADVSLTLAAWLIAIAEEIDALDLSVDGWRALVSLAHEKRAACRFPQGLTDDGRRIFDAVVHLRKISAFERDRRNAR